MKILLRKVLKEIKLEIPEVPNINEISKFSIKRVENIKTEYKEKEFDLEWNYKKQIKKLGKQNNHLHKIIDKFYETVDKFIKWICHKFGIVESNKLIKIFQEEIHTFIDSVKQLEYEEIEKEQNLER